MSTLSIQQMPNGYELEVPTFAYWLKAGMAFTLGAGIVTVTAAACWFFVSFALVAGAFRALAH